MFVSNWGCSKARLTQNKNRNQVSIPMASLTVNLDALDRLRNNQPWSAFADQIGIDAGTLSRIRNGESQPGPKFIANIVTAFPVRIQDIVEVTA